MNIIASPRLMASSGGIALIGQCVLILFGLVGLYAVPPVSGRMLLVPVTAQARAALVTVAVAHGARLVAAGPLSGSLVVDGQRDRLVRPLLGNGVLILSAQIAGCGKVA